MPCVREQGCVGAASLLGVQRHFLAQGEGRYYSPILSEFVCLAENEDITRTSTISRKLATRFLLHGQLVSRRSPLAMLQHIFDSGIKQLVRWQSGRA